MRRSTGAALKRRVEQCQRAVVYAAAQLERVAASPQDYEPAAQAHVQRELERAQALLAIASGRLAEYRKTRFALQTPCGKGGTGKEDQR